MIILYGKICRFSRKNTENQAISEYEFTWYFLPIHCRILPRILRFISDTADALNLYFSDIYDVFSHCTNRSVNTALSIAERDESFSSILYISSHMQRHSPAEIAFSDEDSLGLTYDGSIMSYMQFSRVSSGEA